MKRIIILSLSIVVFAISLSISNDEGNKNLLSFRIINCVKDTKTNNSTLKLSVNNPSTEKYNLGSFVITLYDKDKTMLVTSGASICDYDEKKGCVLNAHQSKEFELIVGVDACDAVYIEYSLD